MGELKSIWVKPRKRAPMEPASSARLDPRGGLVGNAEWGARRQVTVVSVGGWRDAEAVLGRRVDPVARRANLLVEGVDLADSRGKVLRVGKTAIRIEGETKPCSRMDAACPGLRRALAPGWRAGAWGVVLSGGSIALGDPVEIEA